MGVILLGVIITGLYLKDYWLIGKPLESPNQVMITTEDSVSMDGDVSSSDAVSNEKETLLQSDTNQVQVRSEKFQEEVSQAYRFERHVLIGRAFVLAFYNFKGVVPEVSTFEKMANRSIAEAMVEQLQDLKNQSIQREETLTTFTIESTSPLTIRYHIIGKRNGVKEEVSYEVIFDEALEYITSFVQVVR